MSPATTKPTDRPPRPPPLGFRIPPSAFVLCQLPLPTLLAKKDRCLFAAADCSHPLRPFRSLPPENRTVGYFEAHRYNTSVPVWRGQHAVRETPGHAPFAFPRRPLLRVAVVADEERGRPSQVGDDSILHCGHQFVLENPVHTNETIEEHEDEAADEDEEELLSLSMNGSNGSNRTAENVTVYTKWHPGEYSSVEPGDLITTRCTFAVNIPMNRTVTQTELADVVRAIMGDGEALCRAFLVYSPADAFRETDLVRLPYAV